MNKTVMICSLIFVLDFAYGAWFWRAERSPEQWFGYMAINITCVASWWYLLRTSGYSLTMCTVIYDSIGLIMWYMPLLIWREDVVTTNQIYGLIIVMIGSLLIIVG